ncbi:hypothetical protein OG824_01445 [Streptomyces prunicolor]|uniref:hypothetical protein n=1 Tax=Streptomyces prunicolor TaxID=67348 RepID=UPI002251ED9A|nr:hypothetical protein [Streptomyces prunicolor]MCX5233901.1 hypothetical protein [Streptomyces prunicolor]
MATPLQYIANLDTLTLSDQVAGIEHVLLPAVPEFIGALLASLVSTAVTWAFQKWRKRDLPEILDEDMLS